VATYMGVPQFAIVSFATCKALSAIYVATYMGVPWFVMGDALAVI
jgi:hypothetical protein